MTDRDFITLAGWGLTQRNQDAKRDEALAKDAIILLLCVGFALFILSIGG